MKGDDELSKYEMNAKMGQTTGQKNPGCSDKAGLEEQGKASEEDTYVINKPVTIRIVRSPEDEGYRIVEEYDEPMVSRIFAKVGKEYGIEASAAFAPFDDPKFRWCGFGAQLNPRLVPEGTTGSLTRFRYEVSDYFQDAPESVLEGFARTAILGSLKHDLEFSEETIRWLNAPGFSEKNRPSSLRGRGSSDPKMGSTRASRRQSAGSWRRILWRGTQASRSHGRRFRRRKRAGGRRTS